MTTDPTPGHLLPPQGWYPDPAGNPNSQRWWDGARWTEHVRAVPADPYRYVGPPMAAPAAEPRPSFAAVTATGPTTGPTTADGVPLAAWGLRAVATIIDSFIVSMVAAVLLVLVDPAIVERVGGEMQTWLQQMAASGGTGGMAQLPISTTDIDILTAVQAGVTLAYTLVMLRFVGATIGQLVVGIRVVPTDQGRTRAGLPWTMALVRSAAWAVLSSGYAFLGLVQIVSVLLPLFQAKRQTIPDMVAKTQVVKQRVGRV